jgi:hypothetical protein
MEILVVHKVRAFYCHVLGSPVVQEPHFAPCIVSLQRCIVPLQTRQESRILTP